MESPKPVIFISYSHKDRRWLDFVEGHLQVARDHFEIWNDRGIAGGADWEKEIDDALRTCRVFILLVSRHSLVSDFILKKEVKAALEGHWDRGLKIYPIVVEACHVQAVSWLVRMNLRPPDGYALHGFSPHRRNEVMASIAAEICGLVTGRSDRATAGHSIDRSEPKRGEESEADRGTSVPSDVVIPAAGRADDRVPHLRPTLFEEQTRRASDDSDAQLLSAYRTDVVHLLGREQVLDDLRRWLESGRDISIRVLTGTAGRGKTRLGLELARMAAREGWAAGFVDGDELDRFRRQQNVINWAWDRPALIVIDYAASHADHLRDWIRELVKAPDRRPPLRMLLLERQAKRQVGWLASVFEHSQNHRSRAAASLLDPQEPEDLAAIDDLTARRQIFAELLARKRADLVPPEAGVDAEFDRLLRDEKWSGDPLFLMMAGVVAGNHGINNALSLNHTELATIIALRELDRIGDIAARAGDRSAEKWNLRLLARHAAVLATLCKGLPQGSARALIEDEAVRLKCSADISATVASLKDGLPGGGDGREIAPILPDIVGEAAIIYWLGKGGVLSELDADPLESIRRSADTALAGVSQVLVRIAQDFAGAGRDEPVKWLCAIAKARQEDLDALKTMANALPFQAVALQELAIALTQSIADRLKGDGSREGQASEAALGAWLMDLGFRLNSVGRFEEALAASQEAVGIYKHLAETNRDAFLPDLASGLTYLGRSLSNLGRHEEALAASQEAVDICQRLAENRPDALPVLAGSLLGLGHRLSRLGRCEDALAANQKAVDIHRRLAETDPGAFRASLASSLDSLGHCLSGLGRRKEALAASQEAVAMRRRLANAHPDAFLPSLASNLDSLSIQLNEIGRREEAVVVAQEGIAIYRSLAETRPEAFLPLLAHSLTNISSHLYFLGRHNEAAAASQEAVPINRRFAEIRPDAYLPRLALSLNNLGASLSALGQHEEGLPAAQEAVAIYRRLAETRPDAFMRDLATNLTCISECLIGLSRGDEALKAAEEAVAIRRRLAASYPDTFLPWLAWSLKTLGQVHAQARRHVDAASFFKEGLEIIAPFVERHGEGISDQIGNLRQGYITACDEAGTLPDTALLERVKRALDAGRVNSAPQAQ